MSPPKHVADTTLQILWQRGAECVFGKGAHSCAAWRHHHLMTFDTQSSSRWIIGRRVGGRADFPKRSPRPRSSSSLKGMRSGELDLEMTSFVSLWWGIRRRRSPQRKVSSVRSPSHWHIKDIAGTSAESGNGLNAGGAQQLDDSQSTPMGRARKGSRRTGSTNLRVSS